MLKRLLLFLFFLSLGVSCKYDCDGEYYQIREKKEIGNFLCKYRADSIGDCFVWGDQKFIEFTDSCDVYLLSEIRPKKEFYDKYGI